MEIVEASDDEDEDRTTSVIVLLDASDNVRNGKTMAHFV